MQRVCMPSRRSSSRVYKIYHVPEPHHDKEGIWYAAIISIAIVSGIFFGTVMYFTQNPTGFATLATSTGTIGSTGTSGTVGGVSTGSSCPDIAPGIPDTTCSGSGTTGVSAGTSSSSGTTTSGGGLLGTNLQITPIIGNLFGSSSTIISSGNLGSGGFGSGTITCLGTCDKSPPKLIQIKGDIASADPGRIVEVT